MKLKYKKMLLYISMWIMGIGMLTFSFQKPAPDDSLPAQSESVAKLSITESPMTNSNMESEDMNKPTNNVTPTPILTPTISIEEQTKLTLCKDESLKWLIGSYFTAMIKTDGEKLKQLVLDPNCINLELISKKQEYIEKYDNIICYTKPGVADGDFVVYVVYDMKLATIKTYAPSVKPFYVTKKGGSYILDLTLETKGASDLIKEYTKEQDVVDLIKKVDSDFENAQKMDRDLREFIQNLKKSSGSTTETQKKDTTLKSRG